MSEGNTVSSSNVEPSYKFVAFISYRHKGADEKAAIWLRKSLEEYRLPWTYARKIGLPRRLGKCFRDEDELRGEASIHAALRQSISQCKWLIAVCSPRARKSEYCEMEVAAFHDLGRHNRILTVVIDGEPSNHDKPDDPHPDDPYVASLRAYKRLSTTGEQERREKVPCEPYSVNLRPVSGQWKSTTRKIAKLRLIAALMNCDYDTLWKRDRRRAQIHAATWTATIAVVLTILGTMGYYAAASQRGRDVERHHRKMVEVLNKARDLCGTAQEWADRDPELAALLVLQAYRFEQRADPVDLSAGDLTATLDTAFRSVMGRDTFIASLPCPDGFVVADFACSGDGRFIAARVVQGTVESVLPQVRNLIAPPGTKTRPDRPRPLTRVLLWDQTALRTAAFHELPIPNTATKIAVASDGSCVAVGLIDGSVRLFDPSNPDSVPRVVQAASTPVTALALSANGKRMVTVSAEDGVACCDLRPGGQVMSLIPNETTHTNLKRIFSRRIAVTGDGRHVAATTSDHQMVVWDLTEPNTFKRMDVPLEPLTAAEIAPREGEKPLLPNVVTISFTAENKLVAVDEHGVVRLWDSAAASAGDPATEVRNPPLLSTTDQVQEAAIAPSGGRVVASNVIHGALTWDSRISDDPNRQMTSICPFIPAMVFLDENRVAFNDRQGRPKIWTLRRGPAWLPPLAAPPDPDGARMMRDKTNANYLTHMEGLTFDPKGTGLVLCNIAQFAFQRHLWMFDLQSTQQFEASSDSPSWAAPSGNSSMNSMFDSMHASLNHEAVKRIFALEGAVGYSPDGKFLVAAEDRQVRVWPSARTTGPGHEFDCSLSAIHSLAFKPGSNSDGFSFAIGAENGETDFWSCTSAGMVPTAKVVAGSGLVYTVAFSPNRRWFAAGGDDRSVRVWPTDHLDQPPILLNGHTGAVDAMTFSPDGKCLATGSRDGTVRLWDPANPTSQLRVIAPGHGVVRAITFDAAGNYILVACNAVMNEPDGRIGFASPDLKMPSGFLLCFDLKNGRNGLPPIQLPGSFPEIRALALAPDGMSIAGGSVDQTIRFWFTSPEVLVHLAESTVGRNLSVAEWEAFVGRQSDLPYERTVTDLPPG